MPHPQRLTRPDCMRPLDGLQRSLPTLKDSDSCKEEILGLYT